MSKDSTKDLIREELQKLSKYDLINIIAELVSAYVTAYKNSKTTNRKIEVDIDGQKKVFNSMSEASRALGISRDTIRKYNSKNNIKWEII